MLHRLKRLQRNARLEEPRLGIISLWDVENNAVRILAATLRAAGFKVVEIYFKDWISNSLEAASDAQLENLARIIRREELNLAALSIRASAYAHQAQIITEFLHNELDLPVLWGGMHPTMAPDDCISKTDMILKGEGELALLDFMNALKHSKSVDDFLDSKNVWFRRSGEDVVKNSLRPLVQNLDDLVFRDYTSHNEKYFIYGRSYVVGDPMHGDPVFQMMGSRGCIYKCSYCYNSTYKKDVYPGQKWFRVRSPASMVEEIKQARGHWDFKRIRFDDEVFNFHLDWLKDFSKIYPKEIGLPFEIFIEPKLVNEHRMSILRDAGLKNVYMGVQSSERVTGHLYDRRVKNQTIADIAETYHRLGIKPHFQLIFDDPVSTEEDKKKLFEMIATFPHPYDLYLFSMTVFPGSELNHKLIQSGLISRYDIEGDNTKTFNQHRINLSYPRPVEDTFWIALTQMLSKQFVPRPLLFALAKSEILRKHPWPLIQMANATNMIKMGGMAGKMVLKKEMTTTLLRRWLSSERMITT
ncbi:MAG: radical SAM protein [Myxococcota bacterium]|nr:radical SAM protein [Myxococcota bacterium]